MVIISTSATEVSIQAVSPEFGVQLTCILASQAGGGASAGAAAGVSVAAGGACANDTSTTRTLTKAAKSSPQARARSPAREDLLNVMVLTPVRRHWGEAHRAAASVSPVRMRTAWSIPNTKILPSPIWPVLAVVVMVSTTLSTWSDGTATSIFSLGKKLTAYSVPR